MIADSHAHLDMPQFDSDRDAVIQRARDAGVGLILTIGTGSPESGSIAATLALAERYDFLFAGIGVHPHDARLVQDSYWSRMEAWSEHPKVAVWGEIGLDYHYENSPREAQRQVFRRQLEIARERNLPVSIHCRDAWSDLREILRQARTANPWRGVLHSFSGGAELAREFADMGFLISFSGMVTFKSADGIRSAARVLTLDEILVETDCPYLAPVPHRGKRNEPAFVVDVAAGLAGVKEVSLETLSSQTWANLIRLIQAGGTGPGRTFLELARR
jgi:TatD DNase family protein